MVVEGSQEDVIAPSEFGSSRDVTGPTVASWGHAVAHIPRSSSASCISSSRGIDPRLPVVHHTASLAPRSSPKISLN